MSIATGNEAPNAPYGPVPTQGELDDPRNYAAGSEPPSVASLPGTPVYQVGNVLLGDLAIGAGWIAHRLLHKKWHLLQFTSLRAIALVPPTNFKEWMYSRSLVAPYPDLVVVDDRASMRISLAQLSGPACEDVRSQVTPPTTVTPIAATYLASGQLPGNWGNRFKNAWRFWPYH